MERTTVWLLQYKDDDRPARLLLEDNPGPGIDWRSTKTIDSLRPGDPVLYWRGVNAKTGDRGGIVGTGRFTGELGESREQIDKKKKKAVTWHYYPTLFEELFPQELISRDDVISESGLELNWGFGSILEVPPEAAERIDALLKSRRRKGLFLRQRADAAPQIMFIGDAPKTNEDFLNCRWTTSDSGRPSSGALGLSCRSTPGNTSTSTHPGGASTRRFEGSAFTLFEPRGQRNR